MKLVHAVLNVVGFAPGWVGAGADLINAGLYFYEGDYVNSICSVFSAFGLPGNLLGKIGSRFGKAGDTAVNLFKLGTGAFNAVMCVSNGAKGLAAAKKEYKENGFTAEFFCDLLSVAGNGIGFAQSTSAIKSSSNSLKNSGFGQNLKNSLSGMGSKVKSSFGTLGSKLGTKIRGGSKSGSGSVDYKVVKENYMENGERIASMKDIRVYKKLMNEKGIKVLVDKKGKILPSFAAAGFDYNTGRIIIRKNPSLVSLYHEGYHAQQFIELGADEYINIGRLAREEYVYENIVSSGMFNEAEISHSEWYIKKLRMELGGK